MSVGTSDRRQHQTRHQHVDSAPPPFAMRRFTVDEYHRLIDAGILQEGDPYELLDGWITRKMTKNPPHEVCLRLLHQVLGSRIPAGWMYDSQLAITLSTSEPEPDGMIVKGTPRDYLKRHPLASDLALVIEVAEASLAIDRKKAELYARAGIPRYWLINLAERTIEEYSSPFRKTSQAKYKTLQIHSGADELSLKLGRATIVCHVDEVLP